MEPTLDQAVAEMLSELESRLPAPVPAVPPHNVTVVHVRERLAGLGRLRGTERRGQLGPVVLKAHRIEGEVQFQLWADSAEAVDGAVLDLQKHLLQASEALRAAGFLRFQATATTLAESVPALSAWRKTSSFDLLYEHTFEGSDGAEGLIARVPIASDLERPGSAERETRVETDAMVRWDDEGASPLLVRGPCRLGGLAGLAFLPPGPPPAGPVTLTRTFEGALGPPVSLPTATAFVAAVGGEAPAERHARLTFPSIPAFLAALTPAGDPLALGDWNLDGVTDLYEPLSLPLEPTLELRSSVDRFEVRHANPSLGAPAVVYLRLT